MEPTKLTDVFSEENGAIMVSRIKPQPDQETQTSTEPRFWWERFILGKKKFVVMNKFPEAVLVEIFYENNPVVASAEKLALKFDIGVIGIGNLSSAMAREKVSPDSEIQSYCAFRGKVRPSRRVEIPILSSPFRIIFSRMNADGTRVVESTQERLLTSDYKGFIIMGKHFIDLDEESISTRLRSMSSKREKKRRLL